MMYHAIFLPISHLALENCVPLDNSFGNPELIALVNQLG